MKALRLLAIPLLALPFLVAPAPAVAYDCSTLPIGTANLPPTDPEPTVPIWCIGSLGAPQQTGGVDGFGGWVDSFENTISGNSPAHLSNEIGYRTFEDITVGSDIQTQHWEANGYFMADLAKANALNGTDLSPSQTFRFQNGKLVLEGDVAASEPGFSDAGGGDIVWPEIAWTAGCAPYDGTAGTADCPRAQSISDTLYLYGYFGGNFTGGCRLQSHRSLTCALESDQTFSFPTNDVAPCYTSPPSRLIEMSGFQQCGSTHSGFAVDFGAPSDAWRVCPAGTVDPCLDRFRLEWSKAGFVAYLNGIKFAEDSGWPGYVQIPDAIVNGQVPLTVHFGEFGDFADGNVYRFHWGRIAVNPHDSVGNPLGPSASPTFGPSPSPSPSPNPSPTPIPSPSPISISGVPCTVTLNGAQKTGTCSGTFLPG